MNATNFGVVKLKWSAVDGHPGMKGPVLATIVRGTTCTEFLLGFIVFVISAWVLRQET